MFRCRPRHRPALISANSRSPFWSLSDTARRRAQGQSRQAPPRLWGADQIDRCSSSANSLHGQNLAGIRGIRASFQRDNLRRHFRVRVSHAQPASPSPTRTKADRARNAAISRYFPHLVWSQCLKTNHGSRILGALSLRAIFWCLVLCSEPGSSSPGEIRRSAEECIESGNVA
jgi:hypothetical protein